MRSTADQLQLLSQTILAVRGKRARARRELAQVLKISPTTAGQYVDDLIAEGWLDESGVERRGLGRPRRLLSVRAEAGWFAGVELNAERVQGVRVDFGGRAVRTETVYLKAQASVEEILREVEATVRRLGGEAGTPGCLGVGVGAPGLVDSERGVGLHYAMVQGWEQVPIRERLESAFGVPVTLEHNLRVIALAERWFGAGRHLSDYVILGPRSGFGVALMQGGRLVRGARQAAGEVGFWPWPLGGQEAGVMQARLSAGTVYRRLAGLAEEAPAPANLREALRTVADQSGEERRRVVAEFARVVGALHLLLDAQAYFLHGPLTCLGSAFCEEVSREIGVALADGMGEGVRLEPSELGDDAGALGAASLAMEAWSPRSRP